MGIKSFKEAMKNYLHKLSGAENVYFIGEDYIGKMLLEQAAERANEGEICIIYCGNGIGCIWRVPTAGFAEQNGRNAKLNSR